MIVRAGRPCAEIACATESEWLERRQAGVGASEGAAIVGRSSWQSEYGLWYRKTGPVEPQEPTVEQLVGHALEPLIAKGFTEVTGIKVWDPGDYTIWRSHQWPWLFFTPDRVTEAGEPVELKTAKYAAAKAWRERVPIAYQIQNQIQMAVSGASTSYIAVLCDFDNLRWHEVPRHERMIQVLVERTKAFWGRVQSKTPPPTDSSKPTADALRDEFPESDDTVVELPDSMRRLGDAYDKALMREARCSHLKRGIGNRIKRVMQGASVGRLPDGSGFTWRETAKGRQFKRIAEVRDDA